MARLQESEVKRRARALCRWLEAEGWSQQRLADAAKLSQSTVARACLGQTGDPWTWQLLDKAIGRLERRRR